MSTDTVPLLEVTGLSKHFGGARALSDVSLKIHRGAVHGLVGANGAGKSTLIRCLAGVIAPDEGEIRLNGNPVTIGSPRAAEQAGLAFIHQELNLVPHFSSLENILLGARKDTRLGLINWRESRKAAQAAASRIGMTFSLDKRVDELSVAEQWMVMISKALVSNSAMIAMDEPTASLSDTESQRLFRVVRDLAASGVAILYVSHRLDEVLDLSDRITVFRDGRVTHNARRGELDKRGLIRAIVGQDVETIERTPKVAQLDAVPDVVFEAVGVTRLPAVKDVSFQVRAGEVLGIGGLVGAGRTELARLATGADRLDSGSFRLHGKPIDTRSVYSAVRAGVGLVPEERRSQGLMLDKSVAFNMNVGVLRSLRAIAALPFLSTGKLRRRSRSLMDRLQVKARSTTEPVRSLSGGNQQKVLIARWLTPRVKVLFLDEPSRGVDIGARHEIHQAIRDLADTGVGTVVISSDVEELSMLCDRVVVLCEGRLTGELSGDAITEEALIELSYAHTVSSGEQS
jgi:ribose transport system ATP-binding protein